MTEEAINSYNVIIKQDPNDMTAHMALSDLYRSLGRTQDQISSLENAVALGASEPRIFLELGDLLLKANDERGLEYLSKAKENANGNPELLNKRLRAKEKEREQIKKEKEKQKAIEKKKKKTEKYIDTAVNTATRKIVNSVIKNLFK